MKIISNFKDYYDIALGFGKDDLPLYLREKSQHYFHNREITIAEEREALKPLTNCLNAMPKSPYDKGVIAFCGKLYPFYGDYQSVFYSLDSLREDCIKVNAKGGFGYDRNFALEALLNPTKKHTSKSRYLCDKTWEKFQQNLNVEIRDDVFRYYDSPILCLKDDSWNGNLRVTANPQLRDFGFQSQVEPYAAYQAIDIFIGNNLVNQVDLDAHMTDDLKRHAHGFDDCSFKKRKEDNRKRKI